MHANWSVWSWPSDYGVAQSVFVSEKSRPQRSKLTPAIPTASAVQSTTHTGLLLFVFFNKCKSVDVYYIAKKVQVFLLLVIYFAPS